MSIYCPCPTRRRTCWTAPCCSAWLDIRAIDCSRTSSRCCVLPTFSMSAALPHNRLSACRQTDRQINHTRSLASDPRRRPGTLCWRLVSALSGMWYLPVCDAKNSQSKNASDRGIFWWPHMTAVVLCRHTSSTFCSASFSATTSTYFFLK